MATQLQIRRGTSSQVAAFTGAEGEVVVNTTNDSLHVHDGSSAGGFELARVDGSNWAITNAISTTANISFGDNDKAIFGAGSDLQIYHNGSRSIITDQGTGALRISATNLEFRNADDSNLYANGIDGGAFNLYHAGNAKLATTSTGIDVTGTAVTDGVTINSGNTLKLNAASTTDFFTIIQGGTQAVLTADSPDGAANMLFKTTSAGTDTNRMLIAAGGDISFYEDTGTTPKLFWDASAESLGIGTSSPSAPLDIVSSATGGTTIELDNTSTGGRNFTLYSSGSGNSFGAGNFALYDADAAAVRMLVDSSGNVGIGTSSPDTLLELVGADPILTVRDSSTSSGTANATLRLAESGASDTLDAYWDIKAVGGQLQFIDNWNEGGGTGTRVVVDDSGTLLVGKTASGLNTAGFEVASSGRTRLTRDSANVVEVNRTTNDGSLVTFSKDGSTVGSIGTNTSDTYPYFASSTFGFRLRNSTKTITPCTNTGANNDAAVDLGYSSSRFKDLYLSGDVYATNIKGQNDANTKIEFLGSDVTRFVQGGSEVARLDASGNFLVGKTVIGATSAGFAVVNDEYISSTNTATASGSRVLLLNRQSGTGTSIEFRQANTSVGSVSVTASATAYNTTSDQRLKDNIVDAPSASDDIDAIQVRSFDWKADGSHQKYGMVAQELQGVAPEAVTGDADSDDMMGVDYSKLVPMLVKEIQSLRARVQQLENN